MAESKPDYRYKYYKDLKALLLAVTSGLSIAFVGFLSGLEEPQCKGLAVWAIILSLVAITLNLLATFFDYLASGFYWDAKEANKTLNDKWREHYKNSLVFGKISVTFVLVQLLLTISWLILMAIFVIRNV